MANGKLTTCTVAVRDWMVSVLADNKHTPRDMRQTHHLRAIAMIERARGRNAFYELRHTLFKNELIQTTKSA